MHGRWRTDAYGLSYVCVVYTFVVQMHPMLRDAHDIKLSEVYRLARGRDGPHWSARWDGSEARRPFPRLAVGAVIEALAQRLAAVAQAM